MNCLFRAFFLVYVFDQRLIKGGKRYHKITFDQIYVHIHVYSRRISDDDDDNNNDGFLYAIPGKSQCDNTSGR